VVAEDLGDEQDAAGVAYRLLSAAVEPLAVGGSRLGFHLTVGVALADPGAPTRSIEDAASAALEAARATRLGSFRMVDLRAGRAA
jgi:hypothetical protein